MSKLYENKEICCCYECPALKGNVYIGYECVISDHMIVERIDEFPKFCPLENIEKKEK